MQPHTTAPPPDRWPFLRAPDESCDWIRIPTPGEMQDALAGGDGLTGAAKVEYQLGAFILIAWRSTVFALEATEPRAVYRELHEAGWRIERISDLATVIMEAFKQAHTSEEQVEAAEAFTSATPPSVSQT